MKAADVMVPNVVTVGIDATVGEVAAILLNNHISGAPVVDDKGELVGILSEGDLIRRPEIGTTTRHSWWLELISNKWASATEYIKSHSRKVADVMTRDVITAKPDTPLGDIAAMLERNRIKRVPIVEGGKLVGLVSRANILQALASATKKFSSLTTANDSELRKKVQSRLAAEPWRPTMLTVTVQDGTVDLWGLVHSVEEKKAAQLAAETTPGVRAVVNNIIVQRVWLWLVLSRHAWVKSRVTAEEKVHGEHNRVRVLWGYGSQSIEARSIVVRVGNLGRALRPRRDR